MTPARLVRVRLCWEKKPCDFPERSPLRNHKDCFMVLCMKTTVDLPDDLLIRAKQRAAELRRPLRALFTDGLRLQLAGPIKRRKPKKLRWVTVRGGLPAGIDLKDRAKMHEWLRRES